MCVTLRVYNSPHAYGDDRVDGLAEVGQVEGEAVRLVVARQQAARARYLRREQRAERLRVLGDVRAHVHLAGVAGSGQCTDTRGITVRIR